MKISMKATALIICVIMGQTFATAETAEQRWKVQLELGGSALGGEATGELGAALLWEMREWLDIGVSARALSRLDHGEEDALGRDYHMESGYGALRARPKLELRPGWELAFPLEMGNGYLTYRYESEYAEEMRWDEEILDQLSFAAWSAGIENELALGPHYGFFIRAGYRATSPIRTDLADRDALSGFWGDTGISYRF